MNVIIPLFEFAARICRAILFEESRPPEAYEALGPKDLPFWLRDDIDYPEVRRTPVEGTGGMATFIDILPQDKS